LSEGGKEAAPVDVGRIKPIQKVTKTIVMAKSARNKFDRGPWNTEKRTPERNKGQKKEGGTRNERQFI